MFKKAEKRKEKTTTTKRKGEEKKEEKKEEEKRGVGTKQKMPASRFAVKPHGQYQEGRQ